MSVHSPNPHDSARLHVTGAAHYVDDIPLPANTVHLAFGLSTIAAGDITKLDLDPVRAAEGVIAVITAKDLPFANDVSPSVQDEPLLSTGQIHYHGQPIFLVIAKSHLLARKAARLAEITYDQTPALLTIDDALKANSRFEDPIEFKRGDAAKAVQSASRRLTSQLEIGGQEHFYLEGQAALALPDDAGDLTIHSSSQHPSEIQHKVAQAVGLPFAAIRVEVRRMGGGFGGKESQGNALAVACAIAAKQTGRPAKMRYDRDDDMIITGKRHNFRIAYDVGFDAHGQIAGIVFHQYAQCGWAQDLSLPVSDRAMLHADNAYYLENVQILSDRLKTNTVSNTAFRGFGGPQGMVGIEQVMDHIAHELKIDPLEVRRINLYGETGSNRSITPYHMEVEDNIAPALINTLAEQADYATRRAEIAAYNAKNPILKKGLALTPVKFGISFTLTQLNQAGALVHIYTDGSIRLNHGGTEMGQGLFTKVAQVAAQCFARPLSSVQITATDTAKVPNTSATAASSGSDLNGMAVLNACEEIKSRIIAMAAEHWQIEPETIAFTPSGITLGPKTIPFEGMIALAYAKRISLSATGYYATPKLAWDRKAGKGRPFFYFAYGAALTEVTLDSLTGENRIDRVDILHDVGRSLNPAIDIGQIEGGYVQGAGWLTMEELVWNDDGRLTTHAPSTYKIPTASDRPRIFNVSLWDGENTEETIYRSKAVGEPPLMLGISAYLALSNAVAACGDAYPALDAPATPERLLMAVERVNS